MNGRWLKKGREGRTWRKEGREGRTSHFLNSHVGPSLSLQALCLLGAKET